jgi:hypothetical protein
MNPIFNKLSPFKETPIDVDEFLVKCPSCEKHSWADVMIISRYFSYGRIPMFPSSKEANVICKTCGLKRYGMSFNPNLISNYEEVKRKYKHPWWTYIGAVFFG